MRLFAFMVAFVASAAAYAQTFTQIEWGMNKAATPYNISMKVNGIWSQIGTMTASGIFAVYDDYRSFEQRGVDCTGVTDSTALVQSIINANAHKTVYVGVCKKIKISSTIDISNGVMLLGPQRVHVPDSSFGSPDYGYMDANFIWYGALGGTMFSDVETGLDATTYIRGGGLKYIGLYGSPTLSNTAAIGLLVKGVYFAEFDLFASGFTAQAVKFSTVKNNNVLNKINLIADQTNYPAISSSPLGNCIYFGSGLDDGLVGIGNTTRTLSDFIQCGHASNEGVVFKSSDSNNLGYIFTYSLSATGTPRGIVSYGSATAANNARSNVIREAEAVGVTWATSGGIWVKQYSTLFIDRVNNENATPVQVDAGGTLDYKNFGNVVMGNQKLGVGQGNISLGTAPVTQVEIVGTGNPPSLSADQGIFTMGTTGTNQLQCGGYVTGAFAIWCQTKQSTNVGTNFPLSLNPLGGNVGIGTNDPQSTLHVPNGKYAQFENNNAGAPAGADCNSNTQRGRLAIDTTNNRLYICNGATRGWDYVTLTD